MPVSVRLYSEDDFLKFQYTQEKRRWHLKFEWQHCMHISCKHWCFCSILNALIFFAFKAYQRSTTHWVPEPEKHTQHFDGLVKSKNLFLSWFHSLLCRTRRLEQKFILTLHYTQILKEKGCFQLKMHILNWDSFESQSEHT